eukprot:UN27666
MHTTKQYLPVHACFQMNNMESDSIKVFCEILKHKKLQIDSLKLFKNMVDDKACEHIADLLENTAYPTTEVHLSHNCITIEGAKIIFNSLKRKNQTLKYPALPLNAPSKCILEVPLWLRLEYNYIDLKKARECLNELNIIDCGAKSHGSKNYRQKMCGPRKCCINWKEKLKGDETPVHVYMFHLQYKPEDLSLKLPNINTKPTEKKDSADSGPLFIFLDTSAVLRMCSTNTKDMFTFDTLMTKSNNGNFGWDKPRELENEKVCILILFRILCELDGLKDGTNEDMKKKSTPIE